ncbi:MAG: type II secretion system protein GspG [Elusimicrobiota bacterium]
MAPKLFCKFHPKIESVNYCRRCANSLCDNCVRFVNNSVLCNPCSEITRGKMPLHPTDKLSSPKEQAAHSPRLFFHYFTRITFLLLIIAGVYFRKQVIEYGKTNLQVVLTKYNIKIPGLTTTVTTGTVTTGSSEEARSMTDNAAIAAESIQLKLFVQALKVKKSVTGNYPSDFPEFVSEQFGTVTELKHDPGLDSWGNKYVYDSRGIGFELRSCGPDGVAYSTDDIVVTGAE